MPRARLIGITKSSLALYLLGAFALVSGSACLPDPQRMQLGRLLDSLAQARTALAQPSPDLEVCDGVTEVDSRLEGEPGLTDVKPAWPALRDATDALLAVCGQAQLLAQPYDPTSATLAARQRWQAGLAHDLETSCTSLRSAAQALQKAQPC